MALQQLSYTQIKNASASVLSFGAIADGVTDASVALQAAIDSGVGTIELGEGEYVFNTTLNIKNAIVISGKGCIEQIGNLSSTLISTLKYTGSGQPFSIGEASTTGGTSVLSYVNFNNFNLIGTASATTGLVLGTSTRLVNHCSFSNLYISGFTKAAAAGINLKYAVLCDFNNVCSDLNYYGLYTSPTDIATMQTFTNCSFLRNTIDGASIYSLIGSDFINCDFEGNGGGGLYLNSNLVHGLAFYSCWFESNTATYNRAAQAVITGDTAPYNITFYSVTCLDAPTYVGYLRLSNFFFEVAKNVKMYNVNFNVATSYDDNVFVSASAATSCGIVTDVVNYIQQENVLVNSRFDFWQRGTSISDPNGYFCDPWGVVSNGVGAGGTISQEVHTYGQTEVLGDPLYYARWNQTSVPAGQTSRILYTYIENAQTFENSNCILEYYIRSVGSYFVTIQRNYGTGGGPSAAETIYSSGNLTAGDGATFKNVMLSVEVPTVAGKTFGSNNDSFLLIQIQMTSLATLVDFSQARFYQGVTRAPYAPYNLTTELQTTQRYYETGTDITKVETGATVGQYQLGRANFLVKKCKTPTITQTATYNKTGGGSYAGTVLTTPDTTGILYAGDTANGGNHTDITSITFNYIADANLT